MAKTLQYRRVSFCPDLGSRVLAPHSDLEPGPHVPKARWLSCQHCSAIVRTVKMALLLGEEKAQETAGQKKKWEKNQSGQAGRTLTLLVLKAKARANSLPL